MHLCVIFKDLTVNHIYCILILYYRYIIDQILSIVIYSEYYKEHIL